MSVTIKNPITIVNTGGGGEPSSTEAKLTAYNTSTGVLTGENLGTTAGTVYLLDRDTNTYVAQTTSSWGNTSITLTTPVDTSTLEGDTSIAVVMPDGKWTNKLLVTGQVAVTGWAKVYVQDSDTRAVRTVTIDNETDFNKLYSSNNGWGISITIGADTFYYDEIVGVQFGSSFTKTSLNTNFFLAYASSLNQPLTIPSTITSIARFFLYNCCSFNQPLTLPPSLASIDNDFLDCCYSFNQPLTLPSSLATIGQYFLNGCKSFNRQIIIPSALTIINPYFLNNCTSFNQPITVPSTVTSIGQRFLDSCYSFNQPVNLLSSITTIDGFFLSNCYSFNQPLTIPSTVTSIGNGFLQNCYGFSRLTTETTASPTDNNSLSCDRNTVKMYVKGITVTGSGAATWITNLPNRTSSPFRKLTNGNA